MRHDRKTIVHDRWLSGILRRNAYDLTVDDSLLDVWAKRPSAGQCRLVEEMDRSPVFIYSRVRTDDMDAVSLLEGAGFGLVDVRLMLEKPITSHLDADECASVRLATAEDEEAVVALARKSLTCSRFHLDRHIPRCLADATRAQWVMDYFTGKRAHSMVVGTADGRLVGFLLFMQGMTGDLTIDLIAVDEAHRRRGIASDMIACSESRSQDCVRLRVATQVSNRAAIRLYEKLGFRLRASSYVFHYHNPAGYE